MQIGPEKADMQHANLSYKSGSCHACRQTVILLTEYCTLVAPSLHSKMKEVLFEATSVARLRNWMVQPLFEILFAEVSYTR